MADEEHALTPQRIRVLDEPEAALRGFRRKPRFEGAAVVTIAWCRVTAWNTFVKLFWAAVFFCVLGVAMWFVESPATAKTMGMLWVLSLLFGSYWVAVGALNRTSIRIAPEAIEWRHGPLPFMSGGRVALDAVTAVEMLSAGDACGLSLVTQDGIHHTMLPAVDTLGADDESVRFIAAQINERARLVSPEMTALSRAEPSSAADLVPDDEGGSRPLPDSQALLLWRVLMIVARL